MFEIFRNKLQKKLEDVKISHFSHELDKAKENLVTRSTSYFKLGFKGSGTDSNGQQIDSFLAKSISLNSFISTEKPSRRSHETKYKYRSNSSSTDAPAVVERQKGDLIRIVEHKGQTSPSKATLITREDICKRLAAASFEDEAAPKASKDLQICYINETSFECGDVNLLPLEDGNCDDVSNLELSSKQSVFISGKNPLQIGNGSFNLRDRKVLSGFSIAVLQLLVNNLHSQIESLNMQLVDLVVARDELQIERNSQLTDFADLR